MYNCFGDCKSGGNVLDFVASMEKVSLRQAALLLKDWFLVGGTGQDLKDKAKAKAEKLVRKEKQPRAGPINPPLKFELKSLDPEHAFFQDRGILPATIEHFGLGFCSRGLMKGRIAIPIHNEKGELVAYCGRAVSEDQIKQEGKYKMPAGFAKLAVAYNLHRQKGPDRLILVESFLSVCWLYQAGIKNVVALMGSVLGERQEELIVEALGPEGQVILLFDGDEDGQLCREDCLVRLSPKLFVKGLDISDYAHKPHQLKPEMINNLLGQ